MISICIPTHNYIVTDLIAELLAQSKIENTPIEIIVGDDASTDENIKNQNRILRGMSNVKLIEKEVNIGRSAIRNLMAEEAAFEHLIFIDADSSIPCDYLKNYCQNINSEITIGGTTYQPKCNDKTVYLRWLYGIKREKKEAKIRSKNPYSSFTANNFLINKKTFLSIRFSENLKMYGHEDTIFGYELKKRKVHVHHIDNAVIHTGLEPATVFINKTLQAVINLFQLYTIYKNDRAFIEDNKLLMTLQRIENSIFQRPITSILQRLKPLLITKLVSKTPKLWALDLLKLACILELKRNKDRIAN